MKAKLSLSALVALVLLMVVVLAGCIPVDLVTQEPVKPVPRLTEKISIDARENVKLYNGADLLVYSDDHSTSVFTIDGATGNAVAADVTATDDLAAGDDLNVTGDTTLSGFLDLSSTTITPTVAGLNVTPTYSLYRIGSSVATSITLQACTRPGQIVYLYGEDNNNVVVQDSNVRTSAGGTITIAQYDIAAFMCEGSEWIELLLLANS